MKIVDNVTKLNNSKFNNDLCECKKISMNFVAMEDREEEEQKDTSILLTPVRKQKRALIK